MGDAGEAPPPKNDTTPAPAPAAPSASSFWGWGSLVSTIVTTSKQLVDEYGKDLKEFVEVVQTDAIKQKEEVGKTLEGAKAKFIDQTTLIDTLNSTLNQLIAPENPQAPPNPSNQFFDRHQADLDAIRRDPATYCNEVLKSAEWDEFCKEFSLSSQTEEISKLLSTHSEMRTLHSKLVPVAVPHDLFWLRYFFRVRKMQLENSRRRKIIEEGTLLQEEEEVGWGDDEEETVELSKQNFGTKKALPGSELDLSVDRREHTETLEKEEVKREQKTQEEREKELKERERKEKERREMELRELKELKEKEKEQKEQKEKEQRERELKEKEQKEKEKEKEKESKPKEADPFDAVSPIPASLPIKKVTSDDFEIVTKSQTPSPPIGEKPMDDSNFEKALESVEVNDASEEGWGSDWD